MALNCISELEGSRRKKTQSLHMHCRKVKLLGLSGVSNLKTHSDENAARIWSRQWATSQ